MQPLKHISAARYALALVIALIAAAPVAVASYPYTEFAVPGANGTEIQGISGSTIYGDYLDANSTYHGFVLSNGQLTTFNAPQAGSASKQGTVVTGVSGSEVVGYIYDANSFRHGFIETGSVYSTLDAPGAQPLTNGGTIFTAIDGQNEVGCYLDSSGGFGFLYNGSGFTSIIDPLGPTDTIPTAISGSTIAGYYVGATGIRQGFVFDGTNYTTIDDPLATAPYPYQPGGTVIRAMNGTDLLGSYSGIGPEHGFIYDGTTFQTVDFGSRGTILTGESGNTLVGTYYTDTDTIPHSFIATTPEPTATAILLLGGSLLTLRRRRSRPPNIALVTET